MSRRVFITGGALKAMTQGKVSEEWAKHHHGTWAEEMLKETPAPAQTGDEWAKGKLRDPHV